MIRLITVENTFKIKGRGLTLAPLLTPPASVDFKPFTDMVEIRRIDGEVNTFDTMFSLEHFFLENGPGVFKITIVLPEASENEVPVGSDMYVKEETYLRITGGLPGVNE